MSGLMGQTLTTRTRCYIGRDAARRNIKLLLVGRTGTGEEMLEMAGEQVLLIRPATVAWWESRG